MLKSSGAFSKRAQALFLCLLLLFPFLLCPTVYAAQTMERDVIKVGFFAFDGYHMMDENGNRSGYGYDFLRMAARYLNADYEYVGYEHGWDDMLDMLEQGQIDLVTSAQITNDRLTRFAFSKSIGTSSAMLTVATGNTTIAGGDYRTYNGIRIGLLEGSSRNVDLKKFAMEKGFSYTPVYFQTASELEQSLQTGAVDAACTSSLRITDGEQVLDQFGTYDFYVIVRREDTALLDQINYAIEQLNATEGNWKNALNNKYYAHLDKKDLSFTDREQELIRQYASGEKTLLVTGSPDRSPYTYVENGQLKGIIVDYFSQLAEYIGIPYETAVPSDREEYQRWQKEGPPFVFMDSRVASEKWVEENSFSYSQPYTTMHLAMVTRRDFTGEINALAVATAQGLFGIEEGLAPNARRIEVSSRADAMQAVMDGKADATFVYLYTAQQFVNQDKRGLLNYTVLEDPTYAYHVGFTKTASHELAGIFTKAIYAMPAGTFENIASQYTSYKAEDVDFVTWAKIHPLPTLAIGTVVLMMVFLLLMVLERQKAFRRERERSAQLQELATLADSANQAKTKFLNNMSHDIRSPLNAIVGFTSLAASHLDDPRQAKEYLRKITVSSEHLLSLINNVLDMSKIETNRAKLNQEPFILTEQIARLERIARELADQRGHCFTVEIQKLRHNYLEADSVRIRQILMNLLSNAIKYTPDGGKVLLKVQELPCAFAGHAQMEFTVSDNGMGMTPELLAQVFEPFVRSEDSVTNKIQGTGLGMPITKNLVELMGGDIRIDSQPGAGTTVVVTLRLKVDRQIAYKLEARRILLLARDDVLRFNMECTLTQLGATVRTCDSLPQVSLLLKETAFDVILISGGGNAPELPDWVRQLRTLADPDTLIFCLGGLNDRQEEVRSAAAAGGADGFLARPFSLEDMNAAITQARSAEKAPAASALKGMRFLCAEDNALNAEILEAILDMEGASCRIYPDGAALVNAFEAVSPGEFDAILMDVQMPNMNGLDAARAIRTGVNPLGKTIPIIAMTANAFTENIQETRAAGMDAHISKPIDLELLKKTLAHIRPHR